MTAEQENLAEIINQHVRQMQNPAGCSCGARSDHSPGWYGKHVAGQLAAAGYVRHPMPGDYGVCSPDGGHAYVRPKLGVWPATPEPAQVSYPLPVGLSLPTGFLQPKTKPKEQP